MGSPTHVGVYVIISCMDELAWASLYTDIYGHAKIFCTPKNIPMQIHQCKTNSCCREGAEGEESNKRFFFYILFFQVAQEKQKLRS